MSQLTFAYNYIYNNNSCLSLQIIQILADIIDAKDRYSKGHSTRVAEYAREIGKRYGYDNEKSSKIYTISLLHDLGNPNFLNFYTSTQKKILSKARKQRAEGFSEFFARNLGSQLMRYNIPHELGFSEAIDIRFL